MLFDVESSGLDGLEFLPQLLSNVGEKKNKKLCLEMFISLILLL